MFGSKLSFVEIRQPDDTLEIFDFKGLNFDINPIFEHILFKLCGE